MAPQLERELRYGQPGGDTGKFGNTYCRWTLLHTLIVVTLCSMPFWLSWLFPGPATVVNACSLLFISLMWLIIATNAACNMCRLVREPLMEEGPAAAVQCSRTFRHIVVVPCYIDPVEVLFDCLSSLLAQRDPSRLVVVVAFEKKTPDLPTKIRTVINGFEGRFGELLITVHTIQWPVEIPGGCSNKNFALRSAHRHVSTTDPNFQSTSYTITTCDTDTLFAPRYFDVLERCYNEENPAVAQPVKLCVWQGPLFYNWDLDQRPFFVRVTGLMRSLMMLGGLISLNLNPMSVFSYPLELGLHAGFINPRYSVDDIIFLVRMMCSSGQGIQVKLLPVPVISGPTLGTTWWQEVREWARQLRRWIIGSSESFHYFLTHYRGRPFFGGLKWFLLFFTYYALLLCCGGLVGAFASLPLPWLEAVEQPVYLRYAGPIALGVQYLVFLTAFIIDRVAVKHMTVKENINIFRHVAHFVLAPVVLLVYSLIAFYAVVKFAFRGKHDAGHIMAAKTGFGAVTASSVQPNGQQPVVESARQEPPFEPEEAMSGGSFRSTSTRSVHPSFRNTTSSFPTLGAIAAAATGRPPLLSDASAAHGGDIGVLCQVPEVFYFGSTELRPPTDQLPPAMRRPAVVIGLEPTTA